MKLIVSHVALAVDNIDSAKKIFELLAQTKGSSPKLIESQSVNASFIKLSNTSLELLEPVGDNTPISKFLKNRGGGVHHICIQTDEFESLLQKINASGVRTLSNPFLGAKNRRVVFLNPEDTFNILVELEEEQKLVS